MRQYVTFRVGQQLMGLEILLVREINQLLETTYVQHAPDFVVGLVNLRGQIVTIFDLARRLRLPSVGLGEETHNIILKSNSELSPIRSRERREDLATGDDLVGLRVDGIGDVLDVDQTAIEPIPANSRAGNQEFLRGVVPLSGELLVLVDAGALLRKEQGSI